MSPSVYVTVPGFVLAIVSISESSSNFPGFDLPAFTPAGRCSERIVAWPSS